MIDLIVSVITQIILFIAIIMMAVGSEPQKTSLFLHLTIALGIVALHYKYIYDFSGLSVDLNVSTPAGGVQFGVSDATTSTKPQENTAVPSL